MSTLDFDHVGLTVTDFEGTLAFYQSVFGFEVAKRFDVGGEAFSDAVDLEDASASIVHLDAGSARLELLTYDPEATSRQPAALNEPGAAHVGFTVDDLDAFVADLPADVDTLSAPQTTQSGTRLCFLRDPEGNLVEVLER